MLIKKPSILIATYGNFYALPTNISGSSTSLNQQRTGTRQQRCGRSQHKNYATIAGDSSGDHQHHENERHTWPKPPNGHSCPTPYQIFAMKNRATYSKARYYELVKLYHPDRTNASTNQLPHATKIERYRLIVAAHAILSDPTRRSAYDRFGAGWDGKAELGGRDSWRQPSPRDRPGPFSSSDDPIWRNATWEDWERFYEWQAKKNGEKEGVHRRKQTPLYMNNSYFYLLVTLLALMGSAANYNRAQDAGTYFMEQRDAIHDRAAKELRKARQEANNSGASQDRIEWFLRDREATLGVAGSDPEVVRQEKIDRLLPQRDVCRSEEISDKDG